MSDGRQGKYGATSGTYGATAGTYGAYCAAPGMAPTAANGAVAAALTSGWATRTVAAVFTVDVFTVTGTDAQCAVTVQTATALAPQAARAFSPGK